MTSDIEVRPEDVAAAFKDDTTRQVAAFEKAAQGAVTIVSPELVKGDDLLDLVGVDFLATKAVFREGFPRPRGATLETLSGWAIGGYMSLEGWASPTQSLRTINRRRIASGLVKADSLEDLGIEPGMRIVFNDGGTGAYRQVVAHLEEQGIITTPQDIPVKGGKGSSRYDSIPAEWLFRDSSHVGLEELENHFIVATVPLKLRALRGIRISTYPGPTGEPAGTRYLA